MPLTRGAGDDVLRLRDRRRQPDRDASGSGSRGPPRPHERGHDVVGRLPAGEHQDAARATASPARRSSSTAPPTATRSAARPTVATLYSNATTATANPAVTLRSVGANGGQAAAFTYDLARSVVDTRQGNPAWAGQERDAITADPLGRPVLRRHGRGSAAGLGRTWTKVQIPQADEQQRLLANLILDMEQDRAPLPALLVPPARRRARPSSSPATTTAAAAPRVASTRRRRSARPAARSRTGSACAARRTSTTGTPLTDAAGRGVQRAGLRGRVARQHQLRRTGRRARCEGFYSSQLDGWHAKYTIAAGAGDRTARTASRGATTTRSPRSSCSTASASTRTTTTGRVRGSRTGPACSPVPGSRCASPTAAATRSTCTRPRRR